MNTKICSKCKLEQPIENFAKCKTTKSGLKSWCKECNKQNTIQRSLKPKKQIKNKICSKCKQRKTVEEFDRNKNNLDGFFSWCKKCKYEYREKNREKINETNNIYIRKKYKNNIQYKLSLNLRRRMTKVCKGITKGGSAVKDLGCSLEFFKIYLENQFHSNLETGEQMTWNNYREKMDSPSQKTALSI